MVWRGMLYFTHWSHFTHWLLYFVAWLCFTVWSVFDTIYSRVCLGFFWVCVFFLCVLSVFFGIIVQAADSHARSIGCRRLDLTRLYGWEEAASAFSQPQNESVCLDVGPPNHLARSSRSEFGNCYFRWCIAVYFQIAILVMFATNVYLRFLLIITQKVSLQMASTQKFKDLHVK